MKRLFPISFFTLLLICIGCEKQKAITDPDIPKGNTIRYAKGLSVVPYDRFSIIRILKPWPASKKSFTYILKQSGGVIPDSLNRYPVISVPVTKIIVTSTTHVPSLEMLGVEGTLAGFPNLDYVSSEKVRALIDAGKVREVGSNQNLNTEVIIDLQPDLIVGFGISDSNPALDNLQKNGLKVMLNGDWNERSPLGKAEWIKFFGALYGLDAKADSIFSGIEKKYNDAVALAKKVRVRPTVMAGAVYENHWYLPFGNSWGALFIKDAGGEYLWEDSRGTGSLSLPFETVLEKAEHANFWIGSSEFTSIKEMIASNPHYSKFDAFRNRKVYSFSTKKGKTGGLIFYELAPYRPDLVLLDMVKILHPELLPDHELYFFEKLK